MSRSSRQFPSGWLVVTLLGIFVGTALLLGLRDRGAQIAGVLSLAVAVLALLIANAGGGQRLPLVKTMGIAIGIVTLIAGVYVLYLNYRSIDLTEEASVEPATLAVGEQAEVKLGGDPKGRQNLEVGFHITDPEERARFQFCAPVMSLEVSGIRGESITLETGESKEVEIDPNLSSNPITVRLKAEPLCSGAVVNVAVATAVLSK